MKYTFLFLFIVVFACQPTKKEASVIQEPTYVKPKHHSEAIANVFKAHGGFEAWSKMKSLSYLKGDEQTVTNLKNRKIRLESPKMTVGYDGSDVWVLPDSADASRARFYHNLFFYFYAMPFVVGDPGAYYEDVPMKEILGKNYKGVKVSYGAGIGDAPDDNYIVWYDPDSYQMEWLMYTVTYRSSEPSDNYSLIRYAEWVEVNGLTLPQSFQWYEYKNDSVGQPTRIAEFQNIEVTDVAPSESLFEKPEGSQIAPNNKS